MRRRAQYARRKLRQESGAGGAAGRAQGHGPNRARGARRSAPAQGDQIEAAGGRRGAARLTGRLSVQRSGVGFVMPDSGRGGDIFVHASNFGEAWHGDHVEVALLPRRGRSREGVVTGVLKRGRETVTAEIMRAYGKQSWLAQPLDQRLSFALLASFPEIGGDESPVLPRKGDIVQLKPGEPLERGLWAAEILENFGPGDDLDAQERIVKAAHSIPTFFPEEVLAEAESLHQFGRAELDALDELLAAGGRRDLRHIPFVTIDGESARDFDDAIYVEERARGFTLWVGIADVSHYVRPAAGLDREALARGNSYYFPQSVEPMLPEALSNDLCSLKPEVPRLAMVAELPFDREGAPAGGAQFCAAVIQSRARLTYTRVFADVIEGGKAASQAVSSQDISFPESYSSVALPEDNFAKEQGASDLPPTQSGLRGERGSGGEGASRGLAPDGPLSPELHAMLKSAEKLARLMHGLRHEAGGLDFELPEPEVRIDAKDGMPVIAHEERNFAHQLIEMFMVAANEAVAGFLSRRGSLLPYRVHPPPDPDKLQGFFELLARTGLVSMDKYMGRDGGRAAGRGATYPGPAALPVILDAAQGTEAEFVVSRLMLRSLMQARYSLDNEGHFGLASECYCHFTSPIRRYADLLVHRALKHALGLANFGPLPDRAPLEDMLDIVNRNEQASKEAEREILRRMTVLLLRERVGEVFDGVISGVTDFGIFVEMTEIMTEGMISLTSLADDYYDYFPERQELLGRGTRQRFYLGRSLKVRLVEANLRLLEINLELVGEKKQSKDGGRSGGQGRVQSRSGSADRARERGPRQARKRGS